MNNFELQINPVQLKILIKFITSERLRYSDAIPEGVDNDTFKYHLKHLIEKGYLIKKNEWYFLTNQGKLFGHRVDPLGKLQKYFPVAVMCTVKIKDHGEDKILLQKRLKHPSFGEITVVCGKILPGEKIIDSAKRRLFQETGLNADFEYLGVIRAIRLNENNELLNDQWFNICYTESIKGVLIEDNKYWKNYYFPIKMLDQIDKKNLAIKNVLMILSRIDKKQFPFLIEDEEIVNNL